MNRQARSAARRMGVTLPPSTRPVFIQALDERDAAIRLKVEMTTADWPRFRESLGLAEDAFEDSQRFRLGPDEGEWNPSRSATLPTAQLRQPQARCLNVGYDESRAGTVVVFLFWFET